jgi:MFS family permease
MTDGSPGPAADVRGAGEARSRAQVSPRRAAAVVAASTFLFWASLYLYVPVLPLHARELGASLSMVGAVIAAYAIGQVALRIPIGAASDLLGRKPFAVASLVLSGTGAAWLAAASEPWSLFAARTLTGIAAAGWVAISVLFSAYYPPSSTARPTAIIMGVNGSALVLATLVGGVLADVLGTGSTFYGAAGIAFAGALLMSTAPEPRPSRLEPYSWATPFRVVRNPLLLQVSAIAITQQFVTHGVTFAFLPVFAGQLGASKSVVGYITTAGLAAAVVGTGTSPWLVRRRGNAVTVVVASCATLLALVAMPFAGSLAWLGALQTLNGFGRGMLNTVLMGLALQAAPPWERATAMGSYQALYSIGMLAGPAVCGAIADAYGIETVFWVSAGMTTLGVLLVGARRLPRQ